MNPSWKILFETSEKCSLYIELTDCQNNKKPTNALITHILEPSKMKSPILGRKNRAISKQNQSNIQIVGQINKKGSFFFELEVEKGLYCCEIAK